MQDLRIILQNIHEQGDSMKTILFVTASLDGRIAFGPEKTMFDPTGEPEGPSLMGNREDWNEIEDSLRKQHNWDLWMEGSNMLVKESEELPPLPVFTGDTKSLYDDYLPEDVIHRPNHTGWLGIVDGRGRIRNGYKGEGDLSWHIIHFVSHAAPADYLAFLRDSGIPYLVAGMERVDLPEIYRKLEEKLGVASIYTSSGGRLSGALIRAGLLDEVHIKFNPFIMGGTDTPILFRSPDVSYPHILPSRLELISTRTHAGGTLYVGYRVVKNN